MKIDPFVLEQLIATQLPALAAGAVGFWLASSQLRSVASMNPAVLGDAPTVSLRSRAGWFGGVALAFTFVAVVLYTIVQQKFAIRWPVTSASGSTWWVALAASFLALLWSFLGGVIFGPLRRGTAELSGAARVGLGIGLLGLLITAIWFACWLPVHGRVATWTSREQVTQLLAAFVLSKLLVGGLIALARKSTAGHVLAISAVAGLGAQMLALDFSALQLSLVTGALASFFFIGAFITLLRSSTRELSRVALVAVAAGTGVLLVNIFWQASLFAQASPGSGLLYSSALSIAPWGALLAERVVQRLFSKQLHAGSRFAQLTLLLSPAIGALLVLGPVLVINIMRSGVLEDSAY